MKIITREEIINNVAENFKAHYWSKETGWHKVLNENGDSETLYKKLKILKKREEIDKLLGNISWTCNFCDICRIDNDITISLDSWYLPVPIKLCKKCLEKALRILHSVNSDKSTINKFINL